MTVSRMPRTGELWYRRKGGCKEDVPVAVVKIVEVGPTTVMWRRIKGSGPIQGRVNHYTFRNNYFLADGRRKRSYYVSRAG